MPPKQHHYVPETYLNRFCADDGTIWVHDKWTGNSFQSRPKSILKENFYYSQPDHENKTWNHDIEHFFSRDVEAPWPAMVQLIQKGPKNTGELYSLYMFMAALRVRVPNCRKAIEYMLQEKVRLVGATIRDPAFLAAEKQVLDNLNKLLGKNFQSMDDAYNEGAVDVSIDPHQSLAAMGRVAEGFATVVTALQLHFVKNKTPVDFNSSDNPIIYFPMNQLPDNCSPYQFRPKRPFEFIFPITKRYCLYHNSSYPIAPEQIVTTETSDLALVARINRFVGSFADRYLVSSQKLAPPDLPKRNYSPRPVAYRIPTSGGLGLALNFEMGTPLRLPKWDTAF